MPYPFVFWQQPDPFTTPPWGPSGNEYRSLAPQAGPPWGVWQPFPPTNGPYPGASPWTHPTPRPLPSAFPQNTHPNVQQPRPQAHFPSPPFHPSPRGVVGYQPSPQYISQPCHSVRPSRLAPIHQLSFLSHFTIDTETALLVVRLYAVLARSRLVSETRGTSERFLPLFCTSLPPSDAKEFDTVPLAGYFLYYLNVDTDKRSRKVVTFHSTVGFKYVGVKDVWDALQIYAPHVLRGAQCPSMVKWEHLRRVEFLLL
ncbi:hypothetical protein BDZ89DRAFT_1036564 [Hymenopellis radicata]|nr:hypothetical protein BDZ89DRAFT_1036564 [Hymenopellis radicata]